MDIRLTPLDDRDQCFLDSAAESGEMTAACTAVLGLHGDARRIAAIINDRVLGPGCGHRTRRGLCARLSGYGYELLAEMPEQRRAGFLAIGLSGALHWTAEIVHALTSWAYEDMTTGGALENFRSIPRCDHRYRATKGVARKLHAPGWIARYVRLNDTVLEARDVVRPLLEMCRATIPDPHHLEISADFERQMSAFRLVWAKTERGPDYIGAPGFDAPTLSSYEHITRDTPISRPKPYLVLEKKQRRVIGRAAVMAAAIIGSSAVSAFARGEPVVLPGSDIDLKITRIASSASIGHGRLGVSVLDRGGEHVADLCVYIDGTPALDQLTALALHMQAGLERDVIETANVIRYGAAAADHPVFKERVANRRAGPVVNSWDLRREAWIEYREATKHLYLREVRKVVFGRAARGLV